MSNSVSKTIDVETKIVKCIVQARTSKDAQPVTMHWELDYSDVEDASLFEKASRSDVITLQARYRNSPGKFTMGSSQYFNVAKDLLEKPRLTTEDRARRALRAMQAAGLTKEEIREMLG